MQALIRWFSRGALAAASLAALTTLAAPTWAQTVKVTPLGGMEGEFCPQDRALIFEDPNGTRILYDPGRTVAGASDPRLGKVDIVLVINISYFGIIPPNSPFRLVYVYLVDFVV